MSFILSFTKIKFSKMRITISYSILTILLVLRIFFGIRIRIQLKQQRRDYASWNTASCVYLHKLFVNAHSAYCREYLMPSLLPSPKIFLCGRTLFNKLRRLNKICIEKCMLLHWMRASYTEMLLAKSQYRVFYVIKVEPLQIAVRFFFKLGMH